MDVRIEDGWKQRLQDEFSKDYFVSLTEFVKNEYINHTVYPSGRLIFNAFDKCPFEKTKLVIIGQDPYHGPDQAHGLCFSVTEGVRHPPSLRNIFKELNNDLGIPYPESGNLERWARQGVLLINATLTVRAETAGSHQKKGWETFTDEVIKLIASEKENVVFFLWGAYAQKKGVNINKEKHLVLESVHPSPLSASRGFFNNKQFSQCNEFLIFTEQEPIDWR